MPPCPPSGRRTALHRLAIAIFVLAVLPVPATAASAGRPLLVTVDDLPISLRFHRDDAERARITEGLLAVLRRHGIRAVGLVTCGNVGGPGDRRLLARWLEAGHELGNHSRDHLNYTTTDLETYVADVEACRRELAEFLAERGRTLRFFRFPMLREGSTRAQLEAMRTYLRDSGQRNLPVTLDNQDWSFEEPWVMARRRGDEAALARIAEAYHESLHLSVRHHEATGDRLFGREVPQILLLHASEVSAAQWDRLFRWLRDRGYRFAGADEVLSDPAFAAPHAYVGPRGFSLWDRLLVERRREEARREIEALITRQVGAWNRGDLEGFCADYTEDTVFASPSGLSRGRSELLKRYQERYPDRASQGKLTIEVIELATHDGVEVSMLGDARPGRVHSATVVGRWTLRYPGNPDKETASGLTLLVLVRDAGGEWKIVRDASM
jgi:uncharacterized protein (TIGR02246 family)